MLPAIDGAYQDQDNQSKDHGSILSRMNDRISNYSGSKHDYSANMINGRRRRNSGTLDDSSHPSLPMSLATQQTHTMNDPNAYKHRRFEYQKSQIGQLGLSSLKHSIEQEKSDIIEAGSRLHSLERIRS